MSTISRGLWVAPDRQSRYMFDRKRPLPNASQLKSLGKNIRTLRLAKKINQEELAGMAGIERSYMGAIERGERNPSYDKLVSIAKALETELSELVSN